MNGYDAVPKEPNNYETLYEALSGSSSCTLTNTSSNIPDASGKFKIKPDSGTFTVNGGVNTTCSGSPGKPAAVIFVDGDLNITNDLIYSRPTVFIVSGQIEINQTVDEVDAVLISNGTFSDAPGGGFDNLLTVKGSIIGALDGPLGSRVFLNRKVSSGNFLSEHIILQPSYFYYLTDYAGIASTYYKEENP